MKWSEVFETHHTFCAIAKSQDRVASILAGGTMHADAKRVDGSILYEMPNRSGYKWMHAALAEALKNNHPFTVFLKQGLDDWSDLGLYFVHEKEDQSDIIMYTLRKYCSSD